MKFKFCGDSDCQDWILAQINILSKLTSIKLKLILKEVIVHILTGKFNLNNVRKYTSEAKISEDETQGLIAALNFIVRSSVKYNTDSETLSNEMQQLGLPKEHSTTLSKAYSENFHNLREIIKNDSLKLNTLNEYSHEIVTKFENENCSVNCPSLMITMKGTDRGDPIEKKFYVMPEKLDGMINDLEDVLQIMESNETKKH